MKYNYTRLILTAIFLALISSLLIGCTQEASTKNSIYVNIDEELINGDYAIDIIKELSSEKYSGRLSGTKGNNLAVEYIAKKFKDIGLKTPKGLDDYKQYYSQKTIITQSVPTLSLIDSDGNKLHEFDFLTEFKTRTYFDNTRIKGEIKSPIYIIDDGSKFRNIDELDGKVLLIDKKVVDKYQFYGVVQKVLKLNAQINAVIINYDNRIGDVYPISRIISNDAKYNNKNGPIIIYCTDSVYEEIKKGADLGNEISASVNYSYDDVTIPNVIGLIPGTDESLKDEFIIIGAHLDHVGDNKNGTYNPGAYDNASGISGILEVAKVLMNNNIKPKKSILFIAFNGEEEGLYGSRYYANNPIYSLDKSIMINLDCIGVNSDAPLEIASASSNSKEFSEEFYLLAQQLCIECNEVKDDSDHTSFDEKGVNSIMLIDWDPKTLHTINDTTENMISKERLEQTIKLVLYYLDKNAF